MSQQAEAALLIHEKCHEKENTKLSNSVKSIWFFHCAGDAAHWCVSGCGPAVHHTLVMGVDMQKRASGTWGCCG